MGIYLNPGNSGFTGIRNDIYVDKSGMIALINETLETPRRLTCVSRPRRFGKSFAAKMLCAYYDKTCDSAALFDDLVIATDNTLNGTYREHLNQYDVIYFDMTNIMGKAASRDILSFMEESVTEELLRAYPNLKSGNAFDETLINAAELTGNKFVMIIDEWDAPIREIPEIQKKYLAFLRTLFKSSGTTDKIFAAAYMTGILPIKKDGSQSAISDFIEYPILDPDGFASFTGFTEDEVKWLCERYGMNFEDARAWYDGYDFPETHAIYNPYSVMLAMRKKKFGSYWKKTSAAESLMTYINMDFEGLQETVSRLISGEEIEVDTGGFENDFETFKSRDDVLTLLIHLGYLTWHTEDEHSGEEGTVRIPNEEVRTEFRNILKGRDANRKWIELIGRSRKLIEDTIAGNTDEVVKAIEVIRDTQYAPLFYNDEQALRYVIKFAYIAAIDQYLKIEELPSGRGIADVVYLPKRKSLLPALVIELKWNRSSEGAVEQIKRNHYPAVLEEYGGEIVTVGINYDAKTKEHTCEIERIS